MKCLIQLQVELNLFVISNNIENNQLLILVNQLFASANVDFFDQPVTLIVDGESLYQPFSGGLNSPQVQWVNWDDDIENELFILDEDSCVRLYDYINDQQGHILEY